MRLKKKKSIRLQSSFISVKMLKLEYIITHCKLYDNKDIWYYTLLK